MSPVRIYLIGFMGCGKSTIGKALAAELNYDFVDMDEYIVALHGKSVKTIFEQHGEVHFRNLEKEALQILSQKSQVVIATGGGTPCYNHNMDMIHKTGLSIYLKCSIATLHHRLSQAIDRPLVAGKSSEALNRYIKDTLLERKNYYQQADIRVMANISLGLLVAKLLNKIKSRSH